MADGTDRESLVERMPKPSWAGRIVVALLLIAGACAQHRADDPFGSYDPADPFADPFFADALGSEGDSLDQFLAEPAPSAGWLYEGEAGDSRALRDHADPRWSGSTDGKGIVPPEEKTFGEKAQEASLATLSILVGAGMTALPFLLGT